MDVLPHQAYAVNGTTEAWTSVARFLTGRDHGMVDSEDSPSVYAFIVLQMAAAVCYPHQRLMLFLDTVHYAEPIAACKRKKNCLACKNGRCYSAPHESSTSATS